MSGRFKIICVDANPISAGSKFCDEFYTVPYASDNRFVEELLDLSARKKVSVLIPTVDEELLILSRNKEKFERIGTKILVADEEVLINTLDKYLSYKKLHEIYAKTWTLEEFIDNPNSFSLPIIIKPRYGRGSRNVFKCESLEEIKILSKKIDNPILQEYLEEPEYTVDILSDFSGKPIVVVPRRRLEIKAGITWKGIIDLREDIINVSKKAIEKLNLTGPATIQLRYKKGEPKIFEVNPRIGGTSILSVYAGVNIPLLAVKLLLGEEFDINFSIKKIIIARYFEDVIWEVSA